MPQTDNRYSEEAQEIMGMIPPWVVRWGITVIAAILVGIVVACCIIKYPQTVTAPISITTENPPSELTARYDGLLDTVCFGNGDHIGQGELIALFVTSADYDDISKVKAFTEAGLALEVDSFVYNPRFDSTYVLGEMQSGWAEFARHCLDYRHYLSADYIGRRKALIAQQIAKNEVYYSDLKRQMSFVEKDLEYSRKGLVRDSTLRVKGVISEAEYDAAMQAFLNKENGHAGFVASLSQTELSIIQARQQLIELDIQQENEKAEYHRTIRQQQEQFLSSVAQWIEKYAIVSPCNGRMSMGGNIKSKNHITIGETVASVVPDSTMAVVGHMSVPSEGFGKVECGQTVNVRLNGFPYMEYGVLKGRVSSISQVPEKMQAQGGSVVVYAVEVTFPDGLTTTYRKPLPLILEMDGTGDIITDDMRLIEQFIRPIISLFRNR